MKTKLPPVLLPNDVVTNAGLPPGEVVGRVSKKQSQQETWDHIVNTFGDPLLELAKIAFDDQLSARDRKDALKEVVQYGHSKRRAIEITGADGNPFEIKLQLIDSIANSISTIKQTPAG